MTFCLKRYRVHVTGFDGFVWEARNAGKARAAAWRSYCSYQDIFFRDFLKISSIERAPDVEGFGRPILVCGRRAHWVSQNAQYVQFVRPDSDVIINSHPNDVSEVTA